MVKFELYNGNQGFFGYENINTYSYDITFVNEKRATFVYNGNEGPYDPTRDPYKIKMIFEDGKQYKAGDGPYDGDLIFTEGTVTGLRYYNDDADLLLRVSDLDIDLAWLNMQANRNDLFDFRNALLKDSMAITGSKDSGRTDRDGDDIQTGYGNDTVRAKGGDDFIKELAGRDVYDGGGGFDTVSYDQAFWNPHLVKRGIRADLEKNEIIGYDGEVDKLKSIESVRGTYLGDTLKGDDVDNTFMGMQARDTIDGRGGFDRVSFRRDVDQGGADKVKVDLAKGYARDGFGHRDSLKSIEGAEGTREGDTFIGNGKDNWFQGREGPDKFVFKGDAFGWDFIADFSEGDGDRLSMAKADSKGDLSISNDAYGAIIEFGKGTVYLWGVDANDLENNDFIF